MESYSAFFGQASLTPDIFIHVMLVLMVHSFLLLGMIILYSYTTICLSIHLLIEIWVLSRLRLLQAKLLWTYAFISLG